MASLNRLTLVGSKDLAAIFKRVLRSLPVPYGRRYDLGGFNELAA